jgi:hypothetical protein
MSLKDKNKIDFRKLFGIEKYDNNADIFEKIFVGFLVSAIFFLGVALIIGVISALIMSLGRAVILVIIALPILFGVFYWIGNKTMD